MCLRITSMAEKWNLAKLKAKEAFNRMKRKPIE